MNSGSIALSFQDAARELRISPRHLTRLCERGEGPATIKVGRRRIIRREALNTWLRSREAA